MKQNAILFVGTRNDARELATVFGSEVNYSTYHNIRKCFSKEAVRVIPIDFNPTFPETKKSLESKGYEKGSVEIIGASDRPATLWYGLNVSLPGKMKKAGIGTAPIYDDESGLVNDDLLIS